MKKFFKLVQVPAREIRAGQPYVITFSNVHEAIQDRANGRTVDWATHVVEGSVSVVNIANLLPGLPKKETKPWPTYLVRFWNHSSTSFRPINDCWGNSVTMSVKARTKSEAIKRARKINEKTSIYFRVNSVQEIS